MADNEDFEFARDRIMMGIERKSLSMSEQERLHTAIHESGHALTCYYNKDANKLYKATIVARGGALGVVSNLFASIFSKLLLTLFACVDFHGS